MDWTKSLAVELETGEREEIIDMALEMSEILEQRIEHDDYSEGSDKE